MRSHEYSALASKILDMHVRKIAWSNHLCQPKSSCLLLLPWCTAIAGYHTSRKISYNQWLATDKHEIHYWAWVSKGERKPPQMEDTCDNSSTYVNTTLIVLCMSNGLIFAYITGIHDKRIVTSFTTWYSPQTIIVFRILSSILSTGYFPIIYAANNL